MTTKKARFSDEVEQQTRSSPKIQQASASSNDVQTRSSSGRGITVAVPSSLPSPGQQESASSNTIKVHPMQAHAIQQRTSLTAIRSKSSNESPREAYLTPVTHATLSTASMHSVESRESETSPRLNVPSSPPRKSNKEAIHRRSSLASDAGSTKVNRLPGAALVRLASGSKVNEFQAQRTADQKPDDQRPGDDDQSERSERSVDHTSMTSGSLDSDLLGQKGRGGDRSAKGFLAKVPFWIQVTVLMSIPIIFLVIYQSMVLSAALERVVYIQRNTEVLDKIFLCENHLQSERGATSALLEAGAAQHAQYWPDVVTRRAQALEHCMTLRTAARSSAYAVMREEYFRTLNHHFSALEVLRYRVEAREITPGQWRLSMRKIISAITNGITLIAKNSVKDLRLLLQLKDLRATSNRLGMCRSVGTAMRVRGVPSDEILIEFNKECIDSHRRFLRDFRELAGPENQALLLKWDTDPRANLCRSILDMLAENRNGSLPFTSAEVYKITSDAISVQMEMTLALKQRIHDAKDANADLRDAVLMLVLGFLISVGGGVFVGRAQHAASARVEGALAGTRNMAHAVQAFIPRSFLKLMGMSSILSVSLGDETQVAVTLLACDIRNFTGISETMSNDELFEWLQSHFSMMTRVTEEHHGFVDKFVGDAMSCVFSQASDSVMCGISMQTATDKLSSDLICRNQDQVVRIGVGIHSTVVSVGVLGNDKHHSCNIVSPEAQVCDELEGIAKHYGARILITEEVYDQIRYRKQQAAIDVRRIGFIRTSELYHKAFNVYEVYQSDPLNVKQWKTETLDEWNEALAAKESGETEKAQAIFTTLKDRAHKCKIRDPAIRVKLRCIDSKDDDVE